MSVKIGIIACGMRAMAEGLYIRFLSRRYKCFGIQDAWFRAYISIRL